MKKIAIIIISIILIFPFNNVQAKTLGDLKKEYNKLEEKYKKNQSDKNNNTAESAAAAKRIESIYVEIDQAKSDVQKLNKEIEELNKKIKEKNKEVKDLMKFFQVSSGESTYLEYIFSANSITDFIYRLSVTEQLSSYNNKIIKEMHSMIQKNNDNIKELEKKQKSLENLQTELKQKLVVLKEQLKTLDEEEETIEKDIEYNKKIIDFYLKAGCKEEDDINVCARGKSPADSSFIRPLQSGIMFSTWYSDLLYANVCRSHAGVDIAANTGTPIYAIASGTVSVVSHSNYGYGNKVIIHHNVRGKVYTSLYGHMSRTNVKEGDVVTKDTVIGYVGSTGNSEGPHLHLNLCEGAGSCTLRSETIDPGLYINFPGNKQYFYDRTSIYSGYYSDECNWLRR